MGINSVDTNNASMDKIKCDSDSLLLCVRKQARGNECKEERNKSHKIRLKHKTAVHNYNAISIIKFMYEHKTVSYS
jgi:hypothetical protein